MKRVTDFFITCAVLALIVCAIAFFYTALWLLGLTEPLHFI